MMKKSTVRALIEDIGIVPSLRLTSADDARFAVDAVADAGIPIVEVTMTVPDALVVIAEVAKARPDVAVGAGTVIDVDTARRSIEAGARFITSPGVDTGVVEHAIARDILVFPGVLTATDIIAAMRSGADLLKIFPCAPWDGVAYLKSLLGPFPHAKFIASGGINQQTAADFIHAGAVAIGVGTELVPRQAVHNRDRRWITELARRFLAIVHDARRPRKSRDDASSRR